MINIAPESPGLTESPYDKIPQDQTQQSQTTQLEFHQLARAGAPRRWWRPLLVLLVTAVAYALLLLVSLVVVVIAEIELPVISTWYTADLADLTLPGNLAASLAVLALLVPSVLLAVRLVGRRRAGTVTSVAGRLRWPLLWQAAGITLVAFAIATVPLTLLDPAPAPAGTPGIDRLILMLAISLLLVPLQAAGEEYLFRGLLMQTIGAWLRSPWWAILLPLPLFVIGHNYNPLGLLGVGVFAAAASWLTWRSGGLELAIGFHVVNNTAIFVLSAFGLADINSTEMTLPGTLIEIGYTLAVTACCWWLLRRREARGELLQRTRPTRVDVAGSSL